MSVIKYSRDQYRVHQMLMNWCEEVDSRSVLKKKIHSCRGKHKLDRCKFMLTDNELAYIRTNGLVSIREDISNFINVMANPSKITIIKYDKSHPIHCVKYVYGFCCRNCLEDLHSIRTWEKIDSVQIDTLVSLAMKWIQLKIIT